MPILKRLGRVDYEPTWRAMQRFTEERDEQTPDEIWFLEHLPSTLRNECEPGTRACAGRYSVVQIDRGGQVTYHGPGQLVVYPLIDIRRAKLGVRDLVTALGTQRRSITPLSWALRRSADAKAPGVYVDNRKLASVGIGSGVIRVITASRSM